MARIVVLEDEASTRRLITAVLSKAGHEVTDVDNGAEGLLNILAELPDLVVSDVEMPKMNGFEVLSDIRNTPETAQTPVILLTSRSSVEDIQHGLAEGANAYLTKPFDPNKLIEAVNHQLELLAARWGGDAQRLGSGFESTGPGELPGMPAEPATPFPTLELVPVSMVVQTLSPAPISTSAPFELSAPAAGQHFEAAWAVSMEVHNDRALRDALPIQAWRALLRQLFLPVSKDAALRSADYLDLRESRLILYFLDQPAEGKSGYVRAAQAVQAMLRSGLLAKQWAEARLQAADAPALRVLTSLHLGPIDVVRMPLDFGGSRDTVVGNTAEFMQRLREGEPRVVWRVLGTQAAVAASPKAYRLGAKMEISVGSQEVLVHALQGMRPELSQGELLDASAWI
jgi:CheY-like chemotaxis protein